MHRGIWLQKVEYHIYQEYTNFKEMRVITGPWVQDIPVLFKSAHVLLCIIFIEPEVVFTKKHFLYTPSPLKKPK